MFESTDIIMDNSSSSENHCCLPGHLVYEIKMGGNRGIYTGTVLLDILKSFDTVDNTTLFINLSCSGRRDSSRERFKCYLTQGRRIGSPPLFVMSNFVPSTF